MSVNVNQHTTIKTVQRRLISEHYVAAVEMNSVVAHAVTSATHLKTFSTLLSSVERGNCPIVKSTMTEQLLQKFSRFGPFIRVILHIFHCAYFYFQSKIQRYPRAPRPRFPTGRGNSGDSHTRNAAIRLLIFAWIFRTSWPKMGEGVVQCWPPTNSFLLLEVLSSVSIRLGVLETWVLVSRRLETRFYKSWSRSWSWNLRVLVLVLVLEPQSLGLGLGLGSLESLSRSWSWNLGQWRVRRTASIAKSLLSASHFCSCGTDI